jgi:hypothetical protein
MEGEVHDDLFLKLPKHEDKNIFYSIIQGSADTAYNTCHHRIRGL